MASEKVGRPPKYDPECITKVAELCANGATNREVADYLGVTEVTLWRWRAEYPEFCNALKTGKDAADERVIQSLYRRATGYSFNALKIMQYEGVPIEVPYVEHVPPDTTAAIFWLKNRRRDEWRDKQEHEHTGALTVQVVRFSDPPA